MNNRSTLLTFILFTLLLIVILFQVLSMIQSDRLYERLNTLIDLIRDSGVRQAPEQKSGQEKPAKEEYPGDDGDWLVWQLSAEPSSLNPITSSDAATTYIVSGSIFETLIEYDEDTFEYRPLLSESFEISDDGLQIDFILRDDICFSDGEPVTADDVIFSYETIINPGVDALHFANYLQDVDHIEKISDRHVRFIMKRVYFKSLGICGGIEILPEHVYKFDDPEEFNKRISNPVGSGPYVFEKWDIGNEVVLRKNLNYWGKIPNLEKILYKFITNDIAALQSLMSGQVDFISRPTADQFYEMSQDEDFVKKYYCLSYWHPGVGYFWIGWNQDRPFFKDKRVRLALTHIIDREKILKYILKNPGAMIPTGNFYIHGPQYDSSIEPWPYDPEKAKVLLDEAGWIDTNGNGIRDKDGVEFVFKYAIVSGTYLHEQMAKFVKDAAAKVGIEIVIDPYEWSVFVGRVQDRKFDAVNMAWVAGLAGDPYQIWHSSQIGNGGSNYVGFNVPEADRIIEEARRTLDDNQRNELFHQFHRILHEEQPYTFIYTRPEEAFLDKRFENVNIHMLGLVPDEWYVPKEKQRYR
jgi:peptide/nickel transport system substrate-binding protein